MALRMPLSHPGHNPFSTLFYTVDNLCYDKPKPSLLQQMHHRTGSCCHCHVASNVRRFTVFEASCSSASSKVRQTRRPATFAGSHRDHLPQVG